MSPFRVPATGGTPIGENGIEQQGAEAGGADEQSEGGQLAGGRSQRVAGAELSASQADLGAVWGGGREGPAAWQLRAAVEPGPTRGSCELRCWNRGRPAMISGLRWRPN